MRRHGLIKIGFVGDPTGGGAKPLFLSCEGIRRLEQEVRREITQILPAVDLSGLDLFGNAEDEGAGESARDPQREESGESEAPIKGHEEALAIIDGEGTIPWSPVKPEECVAYRAYLGDGQPMLLPEFANAVAAQAGLLLGSIGTDPRQPKLLYQPAPSTTARHGVTDAVKAYAQFVADARKAWPVGVAQPTHLMYRTTPLLLRVGDPLKQDEWEVDDLDLKWVVYAPFTMINGEARKS